MRYVEDEIFDGVWDYGGSDMGTDLHWSMLV